MKTMLAAYLPGNSTVDLREVAVPTPGINQVLIKILSPAPVKEKPLTAGSVTAAMLNTCWRKKKI